MSDERKDQDGQQQPAFNPSPYIINLEKNSRKPERLYLESKFRVMWARTPGVEKEINTRFGITTEIVDHKVGEFIMFKATITDIETGAILATAHKMEKPTKGMPDYVEKCETSSVSRALGLCGFGTQFALEFSGEGDADRPADGPMNGKGQTARPDLNTTAQGTREEASRADQDQSNNESRPITKAQAQAVVELMKAKGVSQEAFIEEFGSLKEKTFGQTAKIIQTLQTRKPQELQELPDEDIPFAEVGDDGQQLL